MSSGGYTVDLVICIDCTGSMRNLIASVKAYAVRMHEDINEFMAFSQRKISSLRVRIIGFRDYYDKDLTPLEESRFFAMPAEKNKLDEFVQEKVVAGGGGDAPENALEALALAIRSDWNYSGENLRHVIAVWTDTDVHPLERATTAKERLVHPYPHDRLPKHFSELTDWWNDQSHIHLNGRRLTLFVPATEQWEKVGKWPNVAWFESRAGEHMNDQDYTAMIESIAQSIAADS